MSYTSGPEEITKGRSSANTGLWVALVVAVGIACFLGGYLMAVLTEQKAAQAGTSVVHSRDADRFSSSQTPPIPGQRTIPTVAREELVIGQPLPKLEFAAIDGRQVSVPDMKGKVVLVEFWATWCGPCIKEIPRMKAMYEEWHDKGLEIVGISRDTDEQKLRDYIAENKIAWPQYFEGRRSPGSPSQRFDIRGVPTIILIDREGKIVSRDLRGAELERTLTAMLSADASEVAAAKAEIARIEGIKQVTARGSRVEDEHGNWMEIVAVEPKPPAVLAPGEDLHIKVRYNLVTDKPVRIWVRPVNARGYAAHGSPEYRKDIKQTDIIDGYFTLEQPAGISEITANMIDSESRKDMMRLTYECSAKWRIPAGQTEPVPAAGASEE